ncbi:MAG: alkaline phosphatase D family protein [Planctomycetota bacterium]
MRDFSVGRWVLSLTMALLASSALAEGGPYLATGVKVGEVDQHSAIVWVRLTRDADRVGEDAPTITVLYEHPRTGELAPSGSGRPNRRPVVVYPDGFTVDTIRGAVPGMAGWARVRYRGADESDWRSTEWVSVDADELFIHQFGLTGLEPGVSYEFEVAVRPMGSDDAAVSALIDGRFTTAPLPEQPADVTFIVATCTSYRSVEDPGEGYRFYGAALELEPEFFVHAGDILYYDHWAKTAELASWGWDRIYSLPRHVEFHRWVPSYFMKDDHDTLMNDAHPGQQTRFMGEFTWDQGLEMFRRQVPMGEKTYRTVRWGKDLQVWMVEGRDYRSSNRMPDGPDKTIWGSEQLAWFERTVEASDATFKVLISPTPIYGPDRGNKRDNHANAAFRYEGDKIRAFLAEQENMVVVCGDRHWQYVTRDPATGVMEFSAGPGSNKHAGGWPRDDVRPEHLYLEVRGGFLEGEVSRASGAPTLTFRHRSPVGELRNEVVIKAE